MCSTAFAADIAPIVDTPVVSSPAFNITGTAGIVGFDMPEFDTGVLGVTDDEMLWGGMLGISAAGAIGNTNGWDVVLGVNAFGAFAGGSSSSSTWTADEPGTLIITGLSTPGTAGPDNGPDLISLSTDRSTPEAELEIVNDNPQGGGSDGSGDVSGGTNNVGFVTPSSAENSFILGALATTTGAAAAYGAIADSDGGIFIATGDIEGLTIETNVSRQLIYTGADLTLGLAGNLSDGVSAQVYAGPSYRGLFQDTTTDININIPEMGDTDVIFPEFNISRLDDLDSNYLGGVVGGNISVAAGSGVLFTLGLEGGVYGVRSTWTGTDTYSTCCGDFGVDPEDDDFQGGESPSYTVTSNSQTENFSDTIAFAVRGNGAVTWAVDENKALSLGGSVEYLSKVATVDHSGLTQFIPGDTSAEWENDGQPAGPTRSWGSMINFAVTASLTGSF